MKVDTYEGWVEYHATVFCIRGDADTGMLLEWANIFRRAGYDVAELVAASGTLALNPPDYRDKHLARLQQLMREARSGAAKRRDAAAEDRFGTCTDCGNSGRVVVPHPRIWDGLAWATLAVTCHCRLGHVFEDQYRAYFNARRDGLGFLTYLEYTKRFPSWKDEWDRRKEELVAFDEARRKAATRDLRSGRLAKSIGGMPS